MRNIFEEQQIQDPTVQGVGGLKGKRSIFETESQEPPRLGTTKSQLEAVGQQQIEARNFRGGMEYIDTPDSFGKSMYDKRVSKVAELEHLQDFRANEQSSIAKLGAGIGKGVSLAATTFVDGTLGLVYGLTQIPNQGLSALWNNDVSNALAEWNEKMEEYLPNYRTEDEENSPWYENLGTMNFWADSFIKNLGFTVGAYYSGAAWTKALKGVGLLKSALPAEIVGSTLSAINEGRIDANNNVGDWQKTQYLQLKDSYSRALGDLGFSGVEMLLDRNTPIVDELMEEINRREREELSTIQIDSPVAQANAALAHNRYNQLRQSVMQNAERLNQLQEDYYKEQQEIQSRGNSMGNGILVANAVLLSYTNFMTYGKLYGGGFKTAKMSVEAGKKATLKEITQNAEKLMGEEALKETSDRAVREGGRWAWNEITKGQAALKGVRTGVREGLEEMNQALISETAGYMQAPDSPDSYYEALLDADAGVQVSNFLPALAKGFVNTYGNGERWEEGAIGALTGLLGMPTFGTQNMSNQTYLGKNKWVGLSGGLFGEFSDAKYQNERGKSAVDVMNRYEQKIQAQKDFFVQSQAFTNLMDGWAAEGNIFEYKNAEDNDAFLAISAYAKLGKLDYLKDLVNHDFENMSDEDLARIASYTSRPTETPTDTRYDGWRGVDGKLLSETEEGRAKMRQDLIEKRNTILKEIDAYENAVEIIRANVYNSPALTKDLTSELAWLYWKTERFKERFNQVKTDHIEHINRFISGLQEWKTALVEAATEMEGDESAKNTLEENKKHQENIDTMSDFLSALQKADNPIGLSSFIEAHPDFIEYLGNKEVYDMYADHTGFTYTDFKTLIGDIRDLGKLSVSAKTFSDRLKEYTENPESILKNRQKIEKKTETKRNNAEVKNFLKDFEEGNPDAFFEGKDLKDIKEGLSKAEKTDGLTEDEYRRIEMIGKGVEARERLANYKQRILDIIQSNSELDPKVREAAQKLILDNPDTSDILDLSSEYYSDIANIYEEADDTLTGKSQEEIEAILKDRLERAVEVLNGVKAIVDKEDNATKGIGTKGIQQFVAGAEKADDDHPASVPPATRAGDTTEPPFVASYYLDFFTNFLGIENPGAFENKPAMDALKYVIDSIVDTAKKKLQNIIDKHAKDKNVLTKEYIAKELISAVFNSLSSTKYGTDLKERFGDSFEDAVAQFIVGPFIERGVTIENNPQNASESSEALKETLIKDYKQNMKGLEEGGIKLYWRPASSRLPINIDEKTPNKLTPYYKLVTEKSFGEHKTGQEKAAKLRYVRAIGEYMESKGAWDRADNGLIGFREEIHFATDPELNGTANAFVILTTDKEGNVLGSLPVEQDFNGIPLDGTFNTYSYLKVFTDYFKAKYNTETGKLDGIVSHIDRWMIGKVLYTPQTEKHSVREIYTIEKSNGEKGLQPIKFGVAAATLSGETRVVVDSDRRQDTAADNSILKPKSPGNGQPYLILPTGNPDSIRKEVAVPVMMRLLTTSDTAINREIRKVLTDIFSLGYFAKNSDMAKLKTKLEELVGARFTVSIMGRQKLTKEELADGTSTSKYQIKLSMKRGGETFKPLMVKDSSDSSSIENVVETAMQALMDNGVRYQMSLKYVNKEYKGATYTGSYNEMLADCVELNLTPGVTHTMSNWFTINPLKQNEDGSFSEVRAESPRSIGTKPKATIAAEAASPSVKIESTATKKVEEKKEEPKQPATLSNNELGSTPENADRIAELEKMAQEEGILLDKLFKSIWDAASIELKEAIGALPMPSEALTTLRQFYDAKSKRFTASEEDIIKELQEGLFRATATEDTEVWSKEEELKWLSKTLPQFSQEDRLQIVDSLIKITNSPNPRFAWGQFKNGIVYIYEGAAKGTLYHEAFHAVSQTLLTDKELDSLYKAAKMKYGDKSTIALEESLAEDFRRYIQYEQDPEVSSLRLFFRKLKHLIQSLFGKDRHIDAMFYRVSRGNFADRQVRQGDTSYKEIRNYYREVYSYNNLSNEDKNFLTENGITEEMYSNIPLEAQEHLFYCR